MAIRGVNAKRAAFAQPQTTSGVIGQAHSPITPFRATGKGYFNRLPDFPANDGNANGSLTNLATSPSNGELYKLWLFIDAIETGWALAGSTAQTPTSRSFYPRNIGQDDLVITGMVANQYEYDRLVQFVAHHHYSQIVPQGLKAQTYDPNGHYPGVVFTLFKPQSGHTFDAFKPLRYLVAITDVAAGHERFKNYPTYQLTCKVLYDYLQTDEVVDQDLVNAVSRQAIFGPAKNPDPSPTTNSKSSTARLTVSGNAKASGATL